MSVATLGSLAISQETGADCKRGGAAALSFVSSVF
jgi:hypothetical protein